MKKILLLMIGLLLVMQITFSQNVGIGTTTPTAKLEIKSDGTSSLANAFMVKNLIGDTLIRVKNNGFINIDYNGLNGGRSLNIGRTGANFFFDDEHFGGAVFPTDSSIVIWSQQSDSNYVILQPQWGKVGIGTYSPKAMLEVKGDIILGAGGTVITKVLKVSVLKNIGSIAAGASSTQTFTIAGANTGSTVYISPESALPDGLIIAYARVSATGTIEVKFMNATVASINPAPMAFFITVIE